MISFLGFGLGKVDFLGSVWILVGGKYRVIIIGYESYVFFYNDYIGNYLFLFMLIIIMKKF